MDINDTSVEVLYDFEYPVKGGRKVSIKEGERLYLIKKTNEDWWQVIRSDERRPFYVPSAYVREVVSKKREKSKSSSLTNVRVSGSDRELSRDKEGGYSVVRLPKKSISEAGEANILEEERLSESLTELARQIAFRPGGRREAARRLDGPRAGSLRTRRSSPRNRHTGSWPDLTRPNNNHPDPMDRSNNNYDMVASGSSSDSLEPSFKPVAKPRKINYHEEVVYANCQELKEADQTRKKDVLNININYQTEPRQESNEKSHAKDSGDKSHTKETSDKNHTKEMNDKSHSKESDKTRTKDSGKPSEKSQSSKESKKNREKGQDSRKNSSSKNNLRDSSEKLGEPSEKPTRTAGDRVYTREQSDRDLIKELSERLAATDRKSSSEDLGKSEGEDEKEGKEDSEGRDGSTVPMGWRTLVDTETQLPCYIHSASGQKWFSSTDSEGRLYFFEEHGGESFWTLPELQLPTKHPMAPQLSEELSAVFQKISSSGVDSSRKIRSAKAFSMIVPDKRAEELSINKNWPELSEGKMYVLCEGPLHYTKVSEGGKKLRKSWSSVYVVLTEIFILIYKDIKSYHSLKILPELTIDLNGADVGSGESFTGRKHAIVVTSQLGLQCAFQCENVNSALHWATKIQRAILDLPKGGDPVNMKFTGQLGECPEEPRKGSTSISRSKSVNFKNKDDSMEDLGGTPAERQMKIRARLKKFFHKRPTMESLVKKGIWKDEPVFGCYLEQACGTNIPRIPPFVQKCISCIESNIENMKTDGLYRASGNLSQIQKIRFQIDQHNYSILEQEEDVHVLTGALKLFFRELKEPLIPFKLFPKAINASMITNRKEKIHQFQDIVKSLPTPNKDTLKFLLQHLLRVSELEESNRMHVNNVAIVFGPTLMWPEQESANMALDMIKQNMVIESLLNDFTSIFK